MSTELIRTLVAMIIAAVMGVLAVRARGQPNRQRALALAALGMVLLGGYNAAFGLRQDVKWVEWAALAVFALAFVFYLLSWTGGEVRQRQEALANKIIAERKRREAVRDAKQKPPAAHE